MIVDEDNSDPFSSHPTTEARIWEKAGLLQQLIIWYVGWLTTICAAIHLLVEFYFVLDKFPLPFSVHLLQALCSLALLQFFDFIKATIMTKGDFGD